MTGAEGPEAGGSDFEYPAAIRDHLERVEPTGALILAAGASSRMGRPKALLEWGERSLIEHQMALLSELPFADVLVMLGHDEAAITAATPALAGGHTAYNARHTEGRSSSIQFGGQILGDLAALLLVNVDQPLSRALLRDLLGGAVENPEAPILIPVHEGRRGHPVMLRRPIFPELAQIGEESAGLKATMHHSPQRCRLIETAESYSLISLNTNIQYVHAIQTHLPGGRAGPMQ